MPDLPIRVAVISRNLVVRSGLVAVIAQLEQRAVVTDVASADDHLEPHDVAIYDRDHQRRGDDDDLRLPAGLTEQEFRVLELIGARMSNPEIANDLYLSINSVKTYVRTAYRKIGATNRASAILWALRHGLAGGPDRR